MAASSTLPINLTVSLGNTLDLVLLLDRVRVRRPLRCVDKLISKAFSDGLNRAEGRFPGAGRQQVQRNVDAAHGRDIDGLAADGTRRSNARGVLTGPRVDDGLDEHLDGVLVGEEVDDVEAMLDDAHSHDLLAVVTAVHHERAHQALDNRALRLPEALDVVAAGGMRQEDGVLLVDGDVVGEAEILDVDAVEGPPVEELDFRRSGRHDGSTLRARDTFSLQSRKEEALGEGGRV